MNKFGFTLAEVLVTLGIIGVVAAMTMPTLISNHQKTVYVTQLKKVYTELSQAAKRAINDNNLVSLDEGKFTSYNPNASKEFLNTYFNVVQDCDTSLTPCFAESYKYINGSSFGIAYEPEAVVSLASGASIAIFINAIGRDLNYLENHGNFSMLVDVNGASRPNIVGRDMFYVQLYSDGKVAEHYDTGNVDLDGYFELCISGSSVYGEGCLSKIIQDGWKMDY